MSQAFTAALFATFAVDACDIEAAFRATHQNDNPILIQQLRFGCDPNALNQHGESLLYVATGPKGGVEVARTLIKAGANPDRGHRGYTPLMNAASWNNLETVELLLTAGANPSLRNEDGKTAQEVVGRAGGREVTVINRLMQATSGQR